MKQAVMDLLQNAGGNYIFPFFWQHGESEEVLREYMRVIHNSGIGAVCVEARPHPDFAGPLWWRDMDIILDEARKRAMKVWILDDAHFPTGQAAGAMENADVSLTKQYIMVERTDICGPLPEATLDVAGMAKTVPSPFAAMASPFQQKSPRLFTDDALLAVIASRLDGGSHVDDTLLDLTAQVVDGQLEWDVPEGMWRIFVLYNTRNGGGRTNYINMLDEASCRVQIDAVYEPHYAHYKDDFGSTIAGFFSDEPAMGNTSGFSFDESIGRKMMPLPWNKDMPGMLTTRLGAGYLHLLPALWGGVGDSAFTARVRYAYMDSATALMAKNFSDQIGQWCEAHNVLYTGHIIEDNNQHSRLGCSQGHFFRSMQGQHMSGIDNIGNQVLLGGENHDRMSLFTPPGDGEFYHFALGKLGSSLAHIDPKKKGRAMCEIYGAYGWNTGVRLMKYMTDHFLVRGINQYVPHAFSPKAFPDPDCPPHFYAHGQNPQYRHFGHLMRYLNRMCHLFNGGLHVAPAALLYHGEAEWTGSHMLLQKPARQLLEHQIDFDILPSDLFADFQAYQASFGETLCVNGEEYRALIIPYAEFITQAVAKFARAAARVGFPVIFIDALPSGLSDCPPSPESAQLLQGLQACTLLPLTQLTAHLTALNLADIRVEQDFPRLRYYHYVKDGQDAYMFSNEDPGQTFSGGVQLKTRGALSVYDAMENLLRPISATANADGTLVQLVLRPYESVVLVADGFEGVAKQAFPAGAARRVLDGEWTLSIASAPEYPQFHDPQILDSLHSVGKIWPNFSGFMRYETTVILDSLPTDGASLSIENAYEGVELWVNGAYAGMKICPPYAFDISGLLKLGANQVRIEVANTLFRKVNAEHPAPNFFGPRALVVEPSGIVGQVTLEF